MRVLTLHFAVYGVQRRSSLLFCARRMSLKLLCFSTRRSLPVCRYQFISTQTEAITMGYYGVAMGCYGVAIVIAVTIAVFLTILNFDLYCFDPYMIVGVRE